ncbi:MAG: hypothetical protein WC707_05955 [Candidatus Babeliaceae bacterium]
MLLQRNLEPIIIQRAQKMPVIVILGPRQSGKTTLARGAFKQHAYVSLLNIIIITESALKMSFFGKIKRVMK